MKRIMFRNFLAKVNGVTGQMKMYRDFERLSRNVASGLFKQGFRKGETLIYISDEPADLHVFLLGVWRANGILRGSYSEDLGDPLLNRIEESRCRWVLCNAENLEAVKYCVERAPWNVNVVAFGSCPDSSFIEAESLFEDSGEACPMLELRLNDIAAVMPTSGTTGKTKGVIFTHERLLLNLNCDTGSLSREEQEQTLLHLGKATHVSALLNFEFIAKGRNLVRLRSQNYSPEIFTQVIEKYRPTEITLNGFLMQKILNFTRCHAEKLKCLKIINLLGTAVRFSVVMDLTNLPGSPVICLLYGSTETLGLCYGDTKSEMIDKIAAGATGKLVPGVDLAVRSESESIVGPGVIGEFWFKSCRSSNGYFNNERETTENFQNGWIRTGDLGYYDKDGFVYITGRLKEVFKYAGNHVSPVQIEEALLTHPAVAEGCVVGITDPNGLGHIPKAYVILNPAANAVCPQDLIDYANARLPTYMHLVGGLQFIEALPYGPGGKVQRHLLCQM